MTYFYCEKTRIERILKYLLIIFLLCTHAITVGQENTTLDYEFEESLQNKAPVIIDGNTLFLVRGISSHPAELRAANIARRIETAASDLSLSTDSVKISIEENKVNIFVDEVFILNLFPEDGESEGINTEILAEIFQERIVKAIEFYRHERSRPVILKKIVYALGALALMIVLIFILHWFFRKAQQGLEKRISKRIESVENVSFSLISSNQLWKTFHLLFGVIRILIFIVVIALFLQYILDLFPWTSNVATYTFNLFLDPLKSIGIGFLQFIPSLAFLVVIFMVTRYFLKLIKLLFHGIGQEAIKIGNFDPEWALPTYKIIRIFILALAVIVAYPYIPGSDTSAFKGVSVFLGVLLSLGSSSFIGNLIAGYSMTYRGAFKKGDRIQVDDVVGFVEEQKLLVTRLISLKNEEIVIPNSVLLNSNITNYSTKAKKNGLILHTSVGINYEIPWRQVDGMLKLAADRTEGLLKEPPPFVLQQSLGDFAVNYEINVYCDQPNKIQYYYTLLHQNILDVFNENNVQIMTPAYEGDPESPKVVPKDQWHRPLISTK